MALIITDFPTGSECTVENLWILEILEASLCKLEKIQHSSGLPNKKYNCAVLCLCNGKCEV